MGSVLESHWTRASRLNCLKSRSDWKRPSYEEDITKRKLSTYELGAGSTELRLDASVAKDPLVRAFSERFARSRRPNCCVEMTEATCASNSYLGRCTSDSDDP